MFSSSIFLVSFSSIPRGAVTFELAEFGTADDVDFLISLGF
jgi:hypothetical protein